MTIAKAFGFFPRLLIAFLTVILVAGVVLYSVGNALGPSLLKSHLESMGITHHNVPANLSTMLDDLEVSYKRALAQSLIWAVLASLLIAGGLSFFITGQVSKPLALMRQGTRRIATGNYGERVSYLGPGELGELASDFNSMAKALEAAETQRSELIRNLAHEFRTPLMNVKGYIEGVEDNVFDFNPELIAALKRQLKRLERLMNDLTLLSRVEAKREPVNPERTNLLAMCEASITAMKLHYVKKNVALESACIPPDLMVWADPIRTEQIISNLLSNALRHTKAGGQVRLWVETSDKQLSVHIKDTGEGIPEEALAHIFKRFYRVTNTWDESSGSGIGLTIAKYFVEAQGGKILVESCLGQGSHFCFTLRAA